MASEVDICNLALAHIGDKAEVTDISPADGSSQAAHCARFYPIARDIMLESHAWGFATRSVTLALLGTAPENWSYSYQYPNGVIKPLAVFDPVALVDSPFVRHWDGADLIYTDVEQASLRYIYRVSDTTRFSGIFIDALSWLLASYLAGPVTRDADIQAKTYQMYLVQLSKAQVADSNGQMEKSSYVPSSIAAR